ncbi:hypothetical protein Y032_0129g1474 [Ancylostoma ceylanicum]|uniref:Uncharacterized protein n=1 Tax=Ancylostoma ceylanicum TaxID=53326 RepID=A0A016T7D1_9BILA|nr:hypothetical protein Y032_0129g1474 [Ancylostoma ceylanicum]
MIGFLLVLQKERKKMRVFRTAFTLSSTVEANYVDWGDRGWKSSTEKDILHAYSKDFKDSKDYARYKAYVEGGRTVVLKKWARGLVLLQPPEAARSLLHSSGARLFIMLASRSEYTGNSTHRTVGTAPLERMCFTKSHITSEIVLICWAANIIAINKIERDLSNSLLCFPRRDTQYRLFSELPVYTWLEHSDTVVSLSENGASGTHSFLMNIVQARFSWRPISPHAPLKSASILDCLTHAGCYDDDIINEAKAVL